MLGVRYWFVVWVEFELFFLFRVYTQSFKLKLSKENKKSVSVQGSYLSAYSKVQCIKSDGWRNVKESRAKIQSGQSKIVTQEWQGMREGGSSKVTQRRGNKGSSGDYNDCTNHRLKVISVNHSLPLLSSASVELHKPEPGNNSQLKVTAELKTCSLRCKYHMSTKVTYLIMNVVIKSIKVQVKIKIFCFLPCFTA